VEQLTGQKENRQKDNKKKSGISGYDQIKFEPLCISKLQTFEKFS